MLPRRVPSDRNPLDLVERDLIAGTSEELLDQRRTAGRRSQHHRRIDFGPCRARRRVLQAATEGAAVYIARRNLYAVQGEVDRALLSALFEWFD
jgi:hypothetical protein